MPSVALVANPRKRRRRRKMSALQRKYFGPRRKTRSRRRHKIRARRRRGTVSVTVRRNPHRRRRHAIRSRRYRRNPSLRGLTGQIMPTLKDGAIGAVGGLLNDVAYGYGKTYLPAALQSGWGRTGTKVVLAVLVGFLGNLAMRGKGRAFAVGAATVTIHEALKEQLAGFMPNLPLGDLMDSRELGYVDPASQLTDQSNDGSQGAYLEQGAYVDAMDSM